MKQKLLNSFTWRASLLVALPAPRSAMLGGKIIRKTSFLHQVVQYLLKNWKKPLNQMLSLDTFEV